MVLSETSIGQTSYTWQGLNLLAQSDNTTPSYFEYDGLGSVRQLTDSTGAVQLAQTFDPYGNLYSSSGTSPTKYAFTGEQQDTNGLLFLRARYYAASSGRFVNTDPSRQEQNPYLYAMGDPIMITDPSGLDADCGMGQSCGRIASIPLVDGDLGMLKYTKYHNPPEDWYGDKFHPGEVQFHNALWRRSEAARLAGLVASLDFSQLGALGYYNQKDSSGKCYDCTRFVSYILWRVGFRMDTEWWANVDQPGGGNSNTWEDVDLFFDWAK
jgi:RHS repeat-associated protein